MNRGLPTVAVLALAVLASGCGDSDGTGPGLSDLAGTYAATSLEFTSIADPGTQYDLIVDGGASFDLVIAADGGYTLTGHFPGFPDEVDTGTIVLDGDEITLDGIDPVSGTFTLDGSTLTIRIPTGAEYDFDDDGTDEPASVRIIFQKS